MKTEIVKKITSPAVILVSLLAATLLGLALQTSVTSAYADTSTEGQVNKVYMVADNQAECVDNWCVANPEGYGDEGDPQGVPFKTSILPADLDAIGLLVMGIWVLTAGVGVAAVGGIVYGSILYTTAGGSQEKTKKGIEIIRNVVIGLLLYVFMFAIINFLVPGGVIT